MAEEQAAAENSPENSPENSKKASPQPQNPSRLEWLVAALSLVLVLGTVGFLFYQALFGETTPPDISLQVVAIVPSSGGYLVTVQAQNRGGETAAELVVEGELLSAGETLETSELTFEFVPAHSSREGGLFFRHDPAGGRLELRAKSYREP